MNDKMQALKREIRNAVRSSKYLVVINGLIKKHRNYVVSVKADGDRLVFFIKTRVSGMWMEEEIEGMEERILEEAASSYLFGFDFTKWSEKYSRDRGQYSFKVTVNPGVRVLYIESDMYNIFRTYIPPMAGERLQFVPQINEGRELTDTELVRLLNTFRLNGFKSLIELSSGRYAKAIRTKTRPFYRITGQHVVSMIRTEDLYNPFFDDKGIYERVKNTKLFHLMESYEKLVKDVNLKAAYLTHRQISEALGLTHLVPFNTRILLSLLVGMIMDVGLVGYEFPHRDQRVMRINVRPEDEELDEVITIDEWLRLDEERRSYYVPSNTYNTFLLGSRDFYRKSGMDSMQRVIDIMRTATLVGGVE